MNFLSKLLSKKRHNRLLKRVNSLEEYQQELLIKQGREQFSKLIEKGLSLPIAVL